MRLRKLVPKLLGAFVLGAFLSVLGDRAVVDALGQTMAAKSVEKVAEWRSRAMAQFDGWVQKGQQALLEAVKKQVQELTR